MPLVLAYSADNRGAQATASGRLMGDELIAVLQEVNARSETTPILYTCFDFDGVTEIDLPTQQLQKAARSAVDAAHKGETPRVVAIVAGSDLAYGLARMYMAFITETGWEAELFRGRAEAVAWLRQRVAAKFGIAIEIV